MQEGLAELGEGGGGSGGSQEGGEDDGKSEDYEPVSRAHGFMLSQGAAGGVSGW